MNTGTLEREMYEQYNRGMASAGGFYLKVGGGEHGRQLVRVPGAIACRSPFGVSVAYRHL